MPFEFNNEKAIDVLIWWVEGSDGSIDYSEEQAVKNVLRDMNYSLDTFYQDTVQYIGALATEDIGKMVENAIAWGSKNFDRHDKQVTLALLNVIAESTGAISPGQQKKLDRIKKEFGIDDLEGTEYE